jgi:hypothetical protein
MPLRHSIRIVNFGKNNAADLAVAVPGQTIVNQDNAGAVNVLYGSAHGATNVDQLWHQTVPGILDGAEKGDEFEKHATCNQLSAISSKIDQIS